MNDRELRWELFRQETVLRELESIVESPSDINAESVRKAIERLTAAESGVQVLKEELNALRASRSFRFGSFVVGTLRKPVDIVRRLRAQLLHSEVNVSSVVLSNGSAAEHDAVAVNIADSKYQKGEAPETLSKTRILLVSDPFTAEELGAECEILYAQPGIDDTEIEGFAPHFLLVESTWRGINDVWQEHLALSPSEALRTLVDACRGLGVATVFWNKEDPLHFLTFLETARLFDLVLTTDANQLNRYRAELGHSRVDIMPFAVQPKLFHPYAPKDAPPRSGFTFAGAWYPHLTVRCRDFQTHANALRLTTGLTIYDRNAKGGRSAYPDQYRHLVKNSVEHTELAGIYRSQQGGLTINTIKHSPTMMARRALDLIACGSKAQSNDTRALNVMFGDLVFASDETLRVFNESYRSMQLQQTDELDAEDIARQIELYRLCMSGHTWSERLSGVWQALTQYGLTHSAPPQNEEPRIFVVIRRVDGVSSSSVEEDLARQSYRNFEIIDDDENGPSRTHYDEFFAVLDPRDRYGKNYLSDLVIATKCLQGLDAYGKGAYLAWDAVSELNACNKNMAYRECDKLPLDRCLIRVESCSKTPGDLRKSNRGDVHVSDKAVSADIGSYVLNGADLPRYECRAQPAASTIHEIRSCVQRLLELPPPNPEIAATPAMIVRWIGLGKQSPGVSAALNHGKVEIVSRLRVGQEGSIFSGLIPKQEFETLFDGRISLDGPQQHHCDWYLDRMDSHGNLLQRQRLFANRVLDLRTDVDFSSYRIATIVSGSFVSYINGMAKDVRCEPLILPGFNRLLVIVNGYPSVTSRYRNAFVHQRVLAYRNLGVPVDVVWVSQTESTRTYEFEGVPVAIVGPEELEVAMNYVRPRAIAVHFLEPFMWQALQKVGEETPVVVWVHGAEIQHVNRRHFNYENEEALAFARKRSQSRINFWSDLLHGKYERQVRFVFVSRQFALESIEDYELSEAELDFDVIHNPIDGTHFEYNAKAPEQRHRVLSIRPHASRIYANDLVAETIRRLSERPEFSEFEFTLVGDGALFDDNFASLQSFENVTIQRDFLSRAEIKKLHASHGIFLVPSRGDTQGVSRDEAMASGLVPITTRVGAIPEFVDNDSGRVVAAEDVEGMVAALLELSSNPTLFSDLSLSASTRVRTQCGVDSIAVRELNVLRMSDVICEPQPEGLWRLVNA